MVIIAMLGIATTGNQMHDSFLRVSVSKNQLTVTAVPKCIGFFLKNTIENKLETPTSTENNYVFIQVLPDNIHNIHNQQHKECIEFTPNENTLTRQKHLVNPHIKSFSMFNLLISIVCVYMYIYKYASLT